MSDRVRTSALFSVLLCLAACGGDSGASTTSCPEGMMSSASCTSPADLMCKNVMKGTPVSICSAGKWGPCACTGAQTGAATGTAGATTAASTASCGDGKAEGDEQCDGADLKGMTCMTLGMGAATSVLKCNSRCQFDALLCGAVPPSTGGTGAAQGGTGARTTTGSAGSGGTGMR